MVEKQQCVDQIKRGQLTFLRATIECINEMIFGRYKLHKATSNMMPILS